MSDPVAGPRSVEFSDPQVNLYVADVGASQRFYRDVLGFRETFRVPAVGVPAHVEVRLGTFTLGLASFESAERGHGIRTSPGPPRSEIALFTEDVDGAFGWATAHGAPSRSPPHDFGGYIHSARVADPDGNPVVFTTRLPVTRTAAPTTRPVATNHLFNLYTRDLDRALPFYRDLLGFTETFRVPRRGPPDHVEMELGPLNLSVSTLEALRRDHGLSGGGGPPRGEVVLWTKDVDAAYAGLVARGAPSVSPPHPFAEVLRGGWVEDPDGNPVQLVARNGPAR
jgi:catechol 2,3-dioxygenase-like lactoylglutathione lyase family enzyme